MKRWHWLIIIAVMVLGIAATATHGPFDIRGGSPYLKYDNTAAGGNLTDWETQATSGNFVINSYSSGGSTLSSGFVFLAPGGSVGHRLRIEGDTLGPSSIILEEDVDNGSSAVTITVPSSMSANRTVTLPDATGKVSLESYGTLYATSVTVTINTADTYTKVVGWTGSANSSGAGYAVMDTTNGTATLGTYGGGKYFVYYSLSFTGGNANTIHCEPFIDGVGNDTAEMSRKLGGTDVGNGGAGNIITLVADEVVDLRCSNLSATDNIVIEHGSFAMYRVGM